MRGAERVLLLVAGEDEPGPLSAVGLGLVLALPRPPSPRVLQSRPAGCPSRSLGMRAQLERVEGANVPVLI